MSNNIEQVVSLGAIASIAVTVSPVLAQSNIQPFTCPRGVPTAIVNKSVFERSFVVKSFASNGVKIPLGIETIRLPDGDRLTIEHSGCENVTYTFKFETNSRGIAISNRRYWFDRVARSMRRVEPGLNTSVNYLRRGISTLETKVRQRDIHLDRQIDYGASDPRSTVTVTNIAALPNSRVALTVVFSYGPI